MQELCATLTICLTCHKRTPDVPLPEREQRAGSALYRAVSELNTGAPGGSALVSVQGVECLAACQRGCCAALSMPGKWAYLLGHLGPHHAHDLLAYAALYAQSKTGTVMPSRRPESLSAVILGRIPF